jgi:hypothetical protein
MREAQRTEYHIPREGITQHHSREDGIIQQRDLKTHGGDDQISFG